jgi:rhodanese-related sulfurtransferase
MSLSSLISRLTSGSSVPALEHDAFQKACLAGECHIVDVREPHEYGAGHIPGAINHPLSGFDPSRLPSDKPVVIVCMSGLRSRKALQLAQAFGRTDVRHYPPGTSGWKARGGALAV